MSSDKKKEGNGVYEASIIAIIVIDFVIACGFSIYGLALFRLKTKTSEFKKREILRV